MTDERASHGKDNTERLLASALGGEARLPPAASRRGRERVLAEVRSRRAAVPFPDAVVALLGGLLVCALAGLALLSLTGSVALDDNPALLLLGAALALNLVLVPVSASVIVLRRQRD